MSVNNFATCLAPFQDMKVRWIADNKLCKQLLRGCCGVLCVAGRNKNEEIKDKKGAGGTQQ
eukprot:scaffold118978_cov19-Tisochrysis_lutea.AAC.1